MEVMSFSQARDAGLSRYFTGKPCSKGHIAEKYVANQKCLRCIRDKITEKRKGTDYASKSYFANKPKRNAQQKIGATQTPIMTGIERKPIASLTPPPCISLVRRMAALHPLSCANCTINKTAYAR